MVATVLNKGLEYFLFLVTMQGKELDVHYIWDVACDVTYSVFSERCPTVWIFVEEYFF